MPIPLFQDWLSLFVLLGEAAKGIYDWAEGALNKSKNQKEKQAVYMLRNAATLVAALRTMHNSVKALLGRVNLLYTDTPVDQRMELMREISDFARRDFIIAFIRQSEKELRDLLHKENDIEDIHRNFLESLLKCAGLTLRAAHDPYGSPFENISELETFLQRIKEADSVQNIDNLKKEAAEAIEAFKSQILIDADDAYVGLKSELLKKFPSIPDPGWAVTLDELK
jgi:hypothetical protein